MVHVDGVPGEEGRRRRCYCAFVFLGCRTVPRRIYGSFAEDIGQPMKFGCSQRDILALRQHGGKATGAALRGAPPVAQQASKEAPAALRRRASFDPAAGDVYVQTRQDSFWLILAAPASPRERTAFRRCPAPPRSRRRS